MVLTDMSSAVSREAPSPEDDEGRSKYVRLSIVIFEHGEDDLIEFMAEDYKMIYDHDQDIDDRVNDDLPTVFLQRYIGPIALIILSCLKKNLKFWTLLPTTMRFRRFWACRS